MLQGSFDTFDFPEVLGMLSRKCQSGKLRMHCGSAVVELYLAEGRLTHAESSDHGIPVRVADSRPRLEETCFEVLRWDHGSFEFYPNAVPSSGRNLDAPVDSVLSGARRRVEEWERVQLIIPSLDVQPRLVSDLAAAEVTISRPSWRILAAVDGRRNGIALARTLGLSHFELSFALADLVSAGLVEVSTRPKVSIAPPSGRTPGLSKVRLPRFGEEPESAPSVAKGDQPAPQTGKEAPQAGAGQDDATEPAASSRTPKGATVAALGRLGGRIRVRPANG
ncbi:MAG TPA: DUF4388 domain-containing protein [Acidimicrobiales bacterium]|nr:DUF4388 domain-containing protein [Acidimicrobiales bacterium]